MATGTVYLDVDDEITSAAARIRGSEATKVALVIPYGSRIATSRMNFRLLSREAVVNNRRLSIVATDPATRALAASAGLPVFASVADWESEAGTAASAATTGDASATDGPAAPTTADDLASGAVAPPPSSATASRPRKRAQPPAPDQAPTLGLAAAAAAGAPSAGVAGGSPAASTTTLPPSRPVPATTPRIPVWKNRSMPRIQAPVALGVAGLILALVVVGVGAYVFLPAAEIVLTPRQEAMSIDLVVRADPDVAAPDATANLVPALVLDVPIEVAETFPATDKRIAEEAATGKVEFQSFNTAAENTIAKGSVVSTEGGIRFQTTATVTLPKAQVIPPSTIQPSSRTVGIVAMKAGTAGNVPANAIVAVPPGEDPTVTKVRNPEATSGGTHQEFPRIGQKDVDGAVAALTPKLTEAFKAAVDSGAGAPLNATVFGETAVLGDATPTVDPATLVGKEQETFDLGLSATGTVVAVDSSPVVKIAETRLLANVGADHRLVEGSIKIVPGDPTVTGGEVSFPVAAKAARVRILDRAELLAMIKGRPVEEARSLLAQFGDAQVKTWPGWVSTIPTLDSRVTIDIVGQTDGGGQASPGPSGRGRPSRSETPRPTARPSASGAPTGPSSSTGPAAPASSASP
jgi:hypothetical protein